MLSIPTRDDCRLDGLARRFICETCDFLTENWDFERVWWPLRCAGDSAPSAPGRTPQAQAPRTAVGASTGKSDKPKSEAAETITAVPVVLLRIDAAAADGLGLGDTYLIVLVPLVRGHRGAPVRMTDASAGPMADDEDWPIWVPEKGTPSRAPARAPRRSTILQ